MTPESDYDELKDALGDLPREQAPPPDLEEAVVEALYERGLLSGGPGRRSMMGRPWLRALVAAAAAVAIFVAGWGGGRATAPGEPTAATTGSRFLLLLYEAPGYRKPPPGGMGERIQEYRDWAISLREQGTLVSAEKLAADGRLIAGRGEELRVMPGMVRSAHGTVTGYFLITAPDYERAVEIARTSPHLRYGGHVAVRRIEPT